MKINRKIVIHAEYVIPDALWEAATDEQKEEMVANFETALNLGADNIENEDSALFAPFDFYTDYAEKEEE